MTRSDKAGFSVATRRIALMGTLGLGAFASASLTSGDAAAQQSTFHLDRVEVPGSPDDGFVLARPYTRQNTIFFAQLALGYSLRPLKTSQVTTDRGTLSRPPSAVIQDQFTSYASLGFELADRVIVGAALPITWIEDGANPSYTGSNIQGGNKNTTVNTSGPAVGDMRLDLRAVLWRSEDRKAAFGAQLSVFAPTGTTANFGGDGQTTVMLGVNGEWTVKSITLVANTGVHFRPVNSINDPNAGSGLGIGDEWRWAVGAFLPIKKNKFRIGGSIFGQTGLENGSITGNTVFTGRNTPIEWMLEGRMRFGPSNHWWTGASVGTRIANGYGAPDFRTMGMIGAYVPILDSNANSPDRKMALREKWRAEHTGDADHDGIPDDLDACPTEPEDHQGSDPNDGCPTPPDRDGDGIPDQFDKCPDVPEDKDGIEDGDGCPEDDADKDGVPDASDACPREPGQPSPDPKRNGCPQFIKMEGSVVRVLQQVHFATGSTTILPDSFPMLQEIANLLKANPSIKRMSIEGHTDDRGDAAMNKKLSDGRAASVKTWLAQHGVEGDRLESHGFGEEVPIADNNTADGRAANRRVEFKIVNEDDGSHKPPPKHTTPDAEPEHNSEIDE